MKKSVFKILIVFILLSLICLNAIAVITTYDVESYIFQINNISDNIKEIKLVEVENYASTNNEDRDFRYEIKEVPLFDSEEISTYYSGFPVTDNYPTIEQENINNYLLLSEVRTIEYAYQYGIAKRKL